MSAVSHEHDGSHTLSILTIPTRAARWRDRPVARWQLAPSLNGVQIVGAW